MLLKDTLAARQRPVLVAGLPRSGSSWLAKVLSTAQSMKYYREPFNQTWQPWAQPFHLQYLSAEQSFKDFDRWCRDAFDGNVDGPFVDAHHWVRHRRFPRWPGRILVKEVHAVLALERIEELVQPEIVVIIRHPCALAASWARLRRLRPEDPHWQHPEAHIARLLEQPALVREWLMPHLANIHKADTYFEQLGVLWGVVYSIMVVQAERRGWTVVTHEALSVNPRREYKALFDKLGLTWTESTSQELADSTSTPSDKPFDTRRISAEEAKKWKQELSDESIKTVWAFAHPFAVGIYPDLQGVT